MPWYKTGEDAKKGKEMREKLSKWLENENICRHFRLCLVRCDKNNDFYFDF